MLCAAELAKRRCKMEESSRRVVYQYEEMQQKAGKIEGSLKKEIYRLMRKIPRKIVAIPINCHRETCSLKKKSASPTVSAPYSEPRTLITATCSIFIPRLLSTNAHAQDQPAHLAAWKTHGLLGNKDRRRDEQRTGQTNHPHGLHCADSGDDANSEHPKQHAKTT